MTTARYRHAVASQEWPRFQDRLWQRNYWEHIISTTGYPVRVRSPDCGRILTIDEDGDILNFPGLAGQKAEAGDAPARAFCTPAGSIRPITAQLIEKEGGEE